MAEKIVDLKIVDCCVLCEFWDDGGGDYKSTCMWDPSGYKVRHPAHICDEYKRR